MSTDIIRNCENCLWGNTCYSHEIDIDDFGNILEKGTCSQFEPIDDNYGLRAYQDDLAMRAELYQSLVEEYQ